MERRPVVGRLLYALCFIVGGLCLTAGPEAASEARDIDLRKAAGQRPTASPGPNTPEQALALEKVRERRPNLTVRWSPLTGSPRRIHDWSGTLSDPQPGPPVQVARHFLMSELALFNLSTADVSQLRTTRDYRTQHNGLHHVSLRQQVQGIDVFGSDIKINLDPEGRVISLAGEPIPGAAAAVNTHVPELSASEAIARAQESARITSVSDSRSEGLVLFPVTVNDLRLAWDVVVGDADSPHAYRTLVDAVDGQILYRRNQTKFDHIPAQGLVFTSDSPDPDTPTGTSSGCCVSRQVRPFHGGEFFPHDDDHYDWWNGAARTTTISNNVSAQEDRDGDDAGGFRPSGVVDEDFSFTLDLTQPTGTEDGATQNQSSAVVNLFYWNNRIHDIYYRLGFDEDAGNFQTDNFGMNPGGAGDAVIADAQDNYDGGDRCNAFFRTEPDGTPSSMKMFVCDSGSPPERDGSFENLIVIHEYTHGLSNRLIADLSKTQGDGMGEGWSDFYGLAITAEEDDDLLDQYPRGQWFYGNVNGNRSEPYSVDSAVNTRTYADINDSGSCAEKVCSNDATMTCDEDDDCGGGNTCDSMSCLFQTDCEPPNTMVSQGPCFASVHRTGQVWANALWIARANMVWKYGFATGGQSILQLVTDGMKLTADDPDFLDARDAILQADLFYQDGANQCLLWDAFAQKGIGVSALSTGALDINPIEAFDTPASCTPNIQINSPLDMGTVCDGGFSTTPLEIFNTGSGDLVIRKIEKIGGDDDITLDANPEPPLIIGEAGHVNFTVRCEATSPGSKSATFRVTSNDADEREIDLVYSCDVAEPDIDTLIADAGDFGDVCLGDFRDLDLTINNSGGCDLTVSNISSDDGDFDVASVMTLPLVIAPGTSLEVPIRFAPSVLGPDSATISITSDDPNESPKDVSVSGNGAEPDILVTGPGDFGAVCAEETVERTISVCNVGLCELAVTGASVDCPDFTIISNPFPAPISHDFCLDLVIAFTPTMAGLHQCTLTVTSDDPDEPVVQVELTAEALLPSIDVPPDLGFPPEVLQDVDACSTPLPFPVSNNGDCRLEITDFSISTNPTEYSLSGLPSFPILLDAGHVAGDGDLDVVFAPENLDRDVLGQVSVQYVSDPYVGTESIETRDLCGEGVRTGARVLVTHGGVPLPEVKMIRLHRLVGNRNGNRLDSVDNVHNVPLQMVTPDSPCGPFLYHREYGTVSNPIQLATGSYSLSVTVRIDNRNLKKTVGFEVGSCDFNPTIVVDF